MGTYYRLTVPRKAAVPSPARAAQAVARRLLPERKVARPVDQADDDFDWRTYSTAYRQELVDLDATLTTRLTPGDATLTAGHLALRPGLPPLHPNHRLLYETIGILSPASVLEAGCGGGDHLHNLSVLYPDVRLHGVDRASGQLDLLRERNPLVSSSVREMDLTLPAPADVPRVDLTFTQAVLMHIQTGNAHRVALSNLFSLARSQVVLMENWLRHEFLADVRSLHAAGVIGWPELHSYVRQAPELGDRPHLLVFSSQPLDLEPVLDDATVMDPLRGS
jgi:SAM-dependent methyltransferase